MAGFDHDYVHKYIRNIGFKERSMCNILLLNKVTGQNKTRIDVLFIECAKFYWNGFLSSSPEGFHRNQIMKKHPTLKNMYDKETGYIIFWDMVTSNLN